MRSQEAVVNPPGGSSRLTLAMEMSIARKLFSPEEMNYSGIQGGFVGRDRLP